MKNKIISTFPIKQDKIKGYYSSWEKINKLSQEDINQLSWYDLTRESIIKTYEIKNIIVDKPNIISLINKNKKVYSEVK